MYQERDGGMWVALIATKERRVWGLPKGLIEKGEKPLQAALREVHEETGVQGRPVADLLPTLTQACPSAEILIISRPSSRPQIRDVAPAASVFDEPEELINTLEALRVAIKQSIRTITDQEGPQQP